MNILICNNRYFPSSGPESYLFAITGLLEKHGHTVVPLAANYSQTVETPYRRYFVPPPVDAESVFFQQYKDRLTWRTRANLVARAAYYPPAREAARRAIVEQQIDLVYLLNTVNVLSPSVIDAAAAQGVPVVMRLSDFNLLCPAYVFEREGKVCQDCLGGYHHALRHRCLQGSVMVTGARVVAMMAQRALGMYKNVDAFITPSRFMASQMEQFKPARGRIFHIPGFVDQTLLDANPTPSTSGGGQIRNGMVKRPYILQFGRISPEKGVDITLRAYAGLERDVDLVIAGESRDDYRLRMEELAKSLGVTTVCFPGFVRGKALSEFIVGALCVVAPSTCYDNAPMSVYESLAYGQVVIGSDLGGISEQLEDCGLLVPPGDAEALRQALRQVIDDPQLRVRLARSAHHRARSEYAPERHYARLLEVFQNVCAFRRHQGARAAGGSQSE
jgi:glycosyltransferase involved in cell wall biosynthesis